ncbi:B-cell receptor CD22-like [Engraulis encrasicolus]|uniref:B-cell receptor CD22-like n=1 Tax=Engraulis encrasicolus TaxID=184585 RepID=UPI002FD4D330
MFSRSVNVQYTVLLFTIIQSIPGVWCAYKVTYPLTEVCGLRGAPVVLPCTFTFSWIGHYRGGGWYLANNNRVSRHRYSSTYPNDCSLRIDKVSERHTARYRFWFYTSSRDWMTNKYAVTLSITDLHLTADRSTATEGESVALTCGTTCPLSSSLSTFVFVWLRNGRQLPLPAATSTHKVKDNRLLLEPVSSEDAGRYSCAVKGQENILSSTLDLKIKYAPKNLTVLATPSRLVEGDVVTLSCSSDANPPVHTYTWHTITSALTSGNDSVQLGTGVTYTISNVTTDHSDRYYCEAKNDIGRNRTDVVHLNVLYFPKNTSVSASMSGALPEGTPVTLSCSSDANPAVHTYTWYTRSGNESLVRAKGHSISFNVTSDTSGLYHCQATNDISSSNSTTVEITVVEREKFSVLRVEVILTIILTAIGLLIMLGVVWLRIRQKRQHHAEPEAKDVIVEDDDDNAVYADISTVAMRAALKSPEDYNAPEDDVQYASIDFSAYNTAKDASEHSDIRQHRGEELEVEYASVKFSQTTTATRSEDSSAIYSTVVKHSQKT